MIAPLDPRQPPAIPVLADAAAAAFAPDGILAAGPRGDFQYESRPEQVAMARAVAEALDAGQHLIVEAGTGVGKSLAYLVSLLLFARRQDHRALVSTYTISLQEQLIGKDLPLLAERLGVPFRAVLVKGRMNYLCWRRLQRACRHAGDLFSGERTAELERIRSWAEQTGEGSLQDLHRPPSEEIWSAVCAEPGNCLGGKCPDRQRCFLQRARAQMQEANLLVVNHHLFFSDLALQQEEAAFLPAVAAIVLDEAHTLEGVASEHFGLRLSGPAFEHWLRRLYVPESDKGWLGYLQAGAPANTVNRLWNAVARLFEDLPRTAGMTPAQNQKTIAAPLALETEVPDLLHQLAGQLKTLIQDLEGRDEDARAELRSLAGQGVAMRQRLEDFLSQALEDHVYWLEREGRRRMPVMYSAPIEVGPVLATALFAREAPVILTSATLAIGGRLDYFRERIGAGPQARLLCLGSPFDHERQMRIYVASNAADPQDKAAFSESVAKGVLRWVLKTKGRAFVLFTSDDLLRQTAQTLRAPLQEAGLTLLAQGEHLSRRKLLETFREDRGYVLFGLDSFWMGVDVRGEALSNVIITRLPFAVPEEPLVAARLQRIKERGGDPFREYALPEAVLKFRQGVGRLIRSKTDEGIVVVLDSRLLRRWYGRIFLQSLPACPIETFEL